MAFGTGQRNLFGHCYMSYPFFPDDVAFAQRFLARAGFYRAAIDGDWGPKTDHAYDAFVRETARIAAELGTFDARSERHIATLLPEAQKAARLFLKKAIGGGHDVRILSGTRSYAEQATLFRKGRWGNPGPRVTNARPGQSLHHHGVAWDIGVFKNGQYQTAQAPYVAVAKYHDPATTEWGGSWKSFKDTPHYQLRQYVKL